jgi:hypothetical protein
MIQLCNPSFAVLLKNSSIRDGTGTSRPNKLASSGLKQPSATKREYLIPLELSLHPLRIRASVRYRQPPADA